MWRPRNFGAQADVRNFLNWLTCLLHPNTAFTNISNGPLKLPKVLWYGSPQEQWLMQWKNLVLMYWKPSALILICRREKAGWGPVSGARCVEIASLIPTMKFYLLRVDLLLRTQELVSWRPDVITEGNLSLNEIFLETSISTEFKSMLSISMWLICDAAT